MTTRRLLIGLAVLCVLVALALAISGTYRQPHPDTPSRAARPIDPTWDEVHFAPGPDCTQTAVGEIKRAKRWIRVQAYGFTSPEIAAALVAAHHRGVDVAVVLDRSNRTARKGQAPMLLEAKIPVVYDAKHPIAHNKVIICDGKVVVTGSFNFTAAAPHNAENLLILRSPDLASRYAANWAVHAGHSEP